MPENGMMRGDDRTKCQTLKRTSGGRRGKQPKATRRGEILSFIFSVSYLDEMIRRTGVCDSTVDEVVAEMRRNTFVRLIIVSECRILRLTPLFPTEILPF